MSSKSLMCNPPLSLSEEALKKSSIVIQAYNNSKRTILGTFEAEITTGEVASTIIFTVLDIPVVFSLLLGQPWFHTLGGVLLPSTKKSKSHSKGRLLLQRQMNSPLSQPYRWTRISWVDFMPLLFQIRQSLIFCGLNRYRSTWNNTTSKGQVLVSNIWVSPHSTLVQDSSNRLDQVTGTRAAQNPSITSWR